MTKMKTTADVARQVALLALDGAAVGAISDRRAFNTIMQCGTVRERNLRPDEIAFVERGIAIAETMIAERAEKLDRAAAERTAREVARNNDDVAIREEVIDALVREGLSRPVAAERTNSERKLLAEGKRLGVI